MQDHPGAPGTARQGSTRIIVSTNDGGKATQPRAPGHERPPAALSAARHGRLSAATGAPGADVPLASTAGAPGQYCLSAAPRAPGHDVSLASPVRAPGHDRLSATPIATVSLPAGLRRLRQEVLPRVPATPNTLIYPHSQRDTARHSRANGFRACPTNPSSPMLRPSPCAAGGPQGGLDHPRSHRPAIPLPAHHPSSASCHPGTGPPAVLLHRRHGLPPPAPLPRSAHGRPPPLARQGQLDRAPLARRPIAGQHHLHGGAGRVRIGR